MNARPAGRTASCSRSDAIARLRHAEKFLEVADLTAQEAEADKAYADVSASLAVLAGIAAGDAACCARLGRRPRGQDHRQATALLAQVSDADDAVRALGRLLDLKDGAQYGVIDLGAAELRVALRAARTVVDRARTAVRS